MKEKRNLLIGMLLGVLICWGLVSFSLPFIVKRFSFLAGFIACLVFVALGLMVFLYRKKDTGVMQKNRVLVRLLTFVLLALGILVSSFVIFNQMEMRKDQTAYQQKEIEHQAAIHEATRNSSLAPLMQNVLDKVDNELKNNPNKTLSDETITRIADLSYSFKPYHSFVGGELSEEKSSPERGQLLLALSKINMDSTSFEKIKMKTSFSGANLSGADLRGANLMGINLIKAKMNEADLRGANLQNAQLNETKLNKSNLKNANLKSANLRKAELMWADLKGAELREVNMNGTNLSNAKLSGADLRGAELQYAQLNGALMKRVNLTKVDLTGTSLLKANLNDANLSQTMLKWVHLEDANMIRTNLSGADFNGAYLSGADMSGVDLRGASLYKATIAEGNWFEKLVASQAKGMEEMQEKFELVENEFGGANYRLIPIKN